MTWWGYLPLRRPGFRRSPSSARLSLRRYGQPPRPTPRSRRQRIPALVGRRPEPNPASRYGSLRVLSSHAVEHARLDSRRDRFHRPPRPRHAPNVFVRWSRRRGNPVRFLRRTLRRLGVSASDRRLADRRNRDRAPRGPTHSVAAEVTGTRREHDRKRRRQYDERSRENDRIELVP